MPNITIYIVIDNEGKLYGARTAQQKAEELRIKKQEELEVMGSHKRVRSEPTILE